MRKLTYVLAALMMAGLAWAQQSGASLPAGTAIRIKLNKAISTATAVPGEAFSGKVADAVVVGGRTVVPAGAAVEGRILRVSEPRRITGRASVRLRPDNIVFADGHKLHISATVVDTDRPHLLDVDDEGRIKGRGRDSGDNIELAAGTGSGAVAGTIIGGGHGALIGAAAGATASTVHWLVARQSAELPEGMEIVLELNRPAGIGN
jgi:hypothetical protein